MRLDKYLKVSRLIKRRTVANEACDAGRVVINGKVAKASADVKAGDVIEIAFGNKSVKVRVTDVNHAGRHILIQSSIRMEAVMEEKVKQKRLHKMHMENRNKLEMTGIVDVISFDLNKVILESDCGMITIKGANLHVSRLSVEKGELDIDGTIESYAYSEVNSYAKKGESMLGRLFR